MPIPFADRFQQRSKINQPALDAGFSLVELVCVLAGVTLLTSIAATTIQNNFVEFENEETKAHLNSAANE